MLIKTKYFGEVDIAEEKVITFDEGIMGFEDFQRYTLLYDNEGDERPNILWLQSMDEQMLAMPIVNPFIIKEDYNPTIEDELVKSLGNLNDENLMVFIALTVPKDVTKMTANLRAPFVINSDNRKGAQVIVENQDYPVKFDAYAALKSKKEEGE